MATPKYKKHFNDMLNLHGDTFNLYTEIQEKYDADKETYKEELTELKFKLMRIIRKCEDRLCAKSENTKFGVYSQGLAEKFWEEIRANFPKLEEVVE